MTTPATSLRMSRQPRANTQPELRVREGLRAAGLRGYRIDHKLPQARPDVVFTRQRIAVFVDGCYWHGCPRHFRTPKTNTEWWLAKIGSQQDTRPLAASSAASCRLERRRRLRVRAGPARGRPGRSCVRRDSTSWIRRAWPL